MSILRQVATNPRQYDSVGNDWLEIGGKEMPWRLFFKEVLYRELGTLESQSVLDIGCGTGWMSQFVFNLGAKSYLGIEPSKRNFNTAVSQYKNTQFINMTFGDFDTTRRFDLITCLMSTEHFSDLGAAVKKLYKLLTAKGRAVIITGDFEAFALEKFNYRVKIEEISADEYVVHTIRPRSVDTVDIIRSPKVFEDAAKSAGFKDIEIKSLSASESLINQVPMYEMFRHKPLYQLLKFSKKRDEL